MRDQARCSVGRPADSGAACRRAWSGLSCQRDAFFSQVDPCKQLAARRLAGVLDDAEFPVANVTEWELVAEETSGIVPKVWLAQPGTDPEVRWLLKTVTIKNDHVHGEDWAEKIASHVGQMLTIPCAEIEMATWNGLTGCIVRNLRPDGYQMQPGSAQLERCGAPGYVHRSAGKDHPGHSLTNIQVVLADALPPPGCSLPFEATAFDVFTGFVLFDAWIANQDRHDQNWSVLIPDTAAPGPTRLSGSYDHASSLGFGEMDAKREHMLSQAGGVERWCARGHANRLEGRPTLIDAAAAALSMASPLASAYWVQRLRGVVAADVRRVLDRVPRMSETERIFAERLLDINRRRLLDACS